MRFGAVLACVVLMLCPLRSTSTGRSVCQMRRPTDGVSGRCPLSLSWDPQSRCVTVRAWIRARDFSHHVKVDIVSSVRVTIRPSRGRKNKPKLATETRVRCPASDNRQLTHKNVSVLWELVSHCVWAEADTVVYASYNTTSTSCSQTYTVPAPLPRFNLSVDTHAKRVRVQVEPGDKVRARLCYLQLSQTCSAVASSSYVTIDPSQSPSTLLHIDHLVPCVCVEVWYIRPDAKRDRKCPFEEESIADVEDVWLSSDVIVYQSSVEWRSTCPSRYLKLSAALCWEQDDQLCTPVPNSTLREMEYPRNLRYNTTSVDKHPQMCLQFSLQGSRHISCPFKSDLPSWEASIGPGRQSVCVYLTSASAAEFSAQLCVLSKTGCTPDGRVHSVRTDGGGAEAQILVPLQLVSSQLCVQVWQSDPALQGRRILCPDYTHRRLGVFAVAALVLVVIVVLFGTFIHRLIKNRSAGWLCIQNPVLLVCSSEQPTHVSAACALASILQGELCAAVHLALWSQCSQKQSAARTAVADLGPIPWLHGQWEAVCKARGKVLIIWGPEAKRSYEEQQVERGKMQKRMKEEKTDEKPEGDRTTNVQLLAERAEKHDCDKLRDESERVPQIDASSVVGSVFAAALTCLEGALQDLKGHRVALVYFEGLGHSRDIPKAFRGIPRYCLPQDFGGLIQELEGSTREPGAGASAWHCWPSLLAKVLSLWLARQFTRRLRNVLPQTLRNKRPPQRWTSSSKSRRRQSELRLPPSGAARDREPLCRSPWRGGAHVSPT